MAIMKCPKKILEKCTMYLVRITDKEDTCVCCNNCRNLIEKYNVRKVYCINV